MKLIKKGEYDLVNISIIGFDPNTGKSFEDCHKEWKAYFDETVEMMEITPWWNVVRRIEIRWRFMKLKAKQGM